MDQSRPTFSTASTARFYKEPGITSVFDKLMVSLVRIAFREMLHRLATADAKNPMVPNWEMRYTARSSMYWFLKGSECINDISWPEYARRLLMALDLEREGADVKDIVRSSWETSLESAGAGEQACRARAFRHRFKTARTCHHLNHRLGPLH